MIRISSCEILAVGSELLLGDIVNTDAAFASQRLSELGFCLYRQSVVGDNPTRLREAISEAFKRSDLLILTGGLGPTCDDITKEVVADYFSLPLVLHEESMERIINRFKVFGRTMTENNVKQAMIPEGATVFPNEWGLAPGVAVEDEKSGKVAVMLPGPPSELEPMFVKYTMPYLQKFSDGAIRSVNLHLFGIGESAAETILRPLMDSSVNPTLAPYAGEGEVRIRVTAKASDEAAAYEMCDALIRTIEKTEVGRYIYAESKTPNEAKQAAIKTLVSRLTAKNATLATAESCTGGMLASSIVDLPGTSEVFLGSVVSYANSVKSDILSVSEETLEKFGAVSEECAAEMCRGVKAALGADFAVSITGIAGPGGGSEQKPVGLVCFGVATPDAVFTKKKLFNSSYGRDKIRHLAAKEAVFMLLEHL